MGTKVWLGGAAARAKVVTVTIPDDITAGQVIVATIGYKTITYTVLSTDTRNTIIDALVALWNASTIPEFAEVTASVETAVVSDQEVYTGNIILTADTAGKPFIVAWTISGGGTNEIQRITLMGATGGTFKLYYQGEATSSLTHDESAEDIESALVALDGIGAGNVSVTGDNGGPWTIEFIGDLSGTNASLLIVNTTNLTPDTETQVITLDSPTGGTWTVRIGADGTPSSNLDYDATAAEVEAAVESLDEVGSGNASVSGSNGGPYTVTFQGTLYGDAVGDLIVDGSSLTGGLADDVSIVETTPGGDGGNQQISMRAVPLGTTLGWVRITGGSLMTGGTFDLTLTVGNPPSTTTVFDLEDIPYDVTIKELQDLIDAYLEANAPNSHQGSVELNGYNGVRVGATARLSDGDNFAMFIFEPWGTSQVNFSLDGTNVVGNAPNAIVNDNISVGEDGYSTASWYFSINGEDSSDIAYDATAAEVEAAIEGISVVGSGNVSVTKLGGADLSAGCTFRVEFVGDLANQYLDWTMGPSSNFDSTNSNLTHSFERLFQWDGETGTSEVQTISISGSPGSGEFGIEYDDIVSAAVSHDATAAEVEDILEAMENIGTGNVSCSGGPLPDTDVVVTFQGSLSGVDLNLMVPNQGTVETTVQGGGEISESVVVVQSVLTQVTTTPNEGPNDYTTTENWSTNELPVDGDKVYIIDSAYSILYGLDQEDVTLAELHIEQTFTGFIGLPIIHTSSSDSSVTYPEYRDLHLKIGATNVYIGDKEGAGSGRIKLDFGSVQTDILITNSGSRLDDSTPAIQLLGTHASNVLSLNRGDVGIAFYPGEVSTFPTIREAYIDNAESDSTLYIGDDVTLTNIYKSGGTLDLKSATTSIEQTAGTMTVYEGAHALINAYAGTVYYNSTGTLTEIGISGDTTLIFDQDRRAKDVTVINVYGSEPEVYDQAGCIASPEVNLQRGAKFEQLFFGSNVSVTIGSIA